MGEETFFCPEPDGGLSTAGPAVRHALPRCQPPNGGPGAAGCALLPPWAAVPGAVDGVRPAHDGTPGPPWPGRGTDSRTEGENVPVATHSQNLRLISGLWITFEQVCEVSRKSLTELMKFAHQ